MRRLYNIVGYKSGLLVTKIIFTAQRLMRYIDYTTPVFAETLNLVFLDNRFYITST